MRRKLLGAVAIAAFFAVCFAGVLLAVVGGAAYSVCRFDRCARREC